MQSDGSRSEETLRQMHIFFDVDYTILSAYGQLRPGVRDTFQKLVDDGHTLHIWSGVGIRTSEIRYHDLEHFVAGVYLKPMWDYIAEWDRQGIGVQPDFIIDDHKEIVEKFGGIVVHPYFYPDDRDREMDGVYQAIRDYAETGSTIHPGFRPPQNGLQ